MARRGRPAKYGPREPNGRINRSAPKPQVEPISGALWQRIVQHGKQLCIDERLVTELGRLNRFGELTIAQTVVGHRIAEIYGRYEGYKRLKRSIRSPSYNATFGEAGIAEELLGPHAVEELERRIRAATSAFHNLVGHYDYQTKITIPGEIPPPLRGPIEDLCVEDRAISPALYPDIRTLLDRLASSWNVAGSERQRPAPVVRRTVVSTTVALVVGEKPAPRTNLDKIVWMQAIMKLRPDLSAAQAEEAYDFAHALKQRAIFRRAKQDSKSNVVVLPPLKRAE